MTGQPDDHIDSEPAATDWVTAVREALVAAAARRQAPQVCERPPRRAARSRH